MVISVKTYIYFFKLISVTAIYISDAAASCIKCRDKLTFGAKTWWDLKRHGGCWWWGAHLWGCHSCHSRHALLRGGSHVHTSISTWWTWPQPSLCHRRENPIKQPWLCHLPWRGNPCPWDQLWTHLLWQLHTRGVAPKQRPAGNILPVLPSEDHYHLALFLAGDKHSHLAKRLTDGDIYNQWWWYNISTEIYPF